jgi:hypothetical protein
MPFIHASHHLIAQADITQKKQHQEKQKKKKKNQNITCRRLVSHLAGHSIPTKYSKYCMPPPMWQQAIGHCGAL